MHNIQCLSGSGGSFKYCCKFIGKVDKKYYTVPTSVDGSLIRWAICLENNKCVTSNKVQQVLKKNNETGNMHKGNL